MLISIIIPSLNEEKLLPNLLAQLSSDKLKNKFNFEIILSDGGSEDKTLEIAKQFCDEIVYHLNGTRQTISQGKNAGFKKSKGDVLVFLCADCLLENPEKFFTFIQKKFWVSEYDAATFRFDVFPNDRKISDILFHSFYNNYVKFINLIGLGMGRGECQVIKRGIFESLKGFDESLKAGEDFDLYKKIRKRGKIFLADDIIVFESPRRYRKYGYRKVFWLWLKNALNVMNLSKKQVDEWEPIR